MLGNLLAVVLAAASLLLRLSGDPAEAVLPWGLLLSCLIAAILLFTGWRGATRVRRSGPLLWPTNFLNGHWLYALG